MMNNYCIISVSGYGNSGAGAVIDLLKNNNDIQVDDKHEWQILHQIDGILDLKYYLVQNRDKIASNTAIKRFLYSLSDNKSIQIDNRFRKEYVQLSKKYIESLIQCTWNGYSALDGYDIQGIERYKLGRLFYGALRVFFRKFGMELNLPPSKIRFFSMLSEEDFDSITSQYLTDLLHTAGFDPEIPLLLEQLFIFSNPTRGHEFFENAKTILVDRDPRDVYASSRFSAKDGEPVRICRFFPSNNAEDFVKYFIALHNNIEYTKNVLHIQFEDLIYKTNEVIDSLSNFLNIKISLQDSNFHPEKSINNTRFYQKCPMIAKDIDYISAQLEEYLYFK